MLHWFKVTGRYVGPRDWSRDLQIHYLRGKDANTVTRRAVREFRIEVYSVTPLVALASRLLVAGVSKCIVETHQRQIVLGKLQLPSQIKIRIEVNNPRDRNAVAVLNAHSKLLGYLPKDSQIKQFAKYCYENSSRTFYSVWVYAYRERKDARGKWWPDLEIICVVATNGASKQDVAETLKIMGKTQRPGIEKKIADGKFFRLKEREFRW